MARGDHQDDDDDFMEPPPQNRGDEKAAAGEMGMQALMMVRCMNLVNHVCDWLSEIYEPASREFTIPGRGRLPLNEESVFCTLGVPCGEIKVPYEVNNKIEEALFTHLFPGMASMPNTIVLSTSLEGMITHGEGFKMKLLMYLISAVFAPTTSLRPSNKCFPFLAKLKDVKNMNWCKFLADFLHDAFSNKMYQNGCRLHLMHHWRVCHWRVSNSTTSSCIVPPRASPPPSSSVHLPALGWTAANPTPSSASPAQRRVPWQPPLSRETVSDLHCDHCIAYKGLRSPLISDEG